MLPILLPLALVLLAFQPQAGFAATYTAPESPRLIQNLNHSWKFMRQHVTNAELYSFDDSSWTDLSVPHTWNDKDGQDGGSNYYRGIGWYRRHLTLPSQFAGRRVFLKFDGANLVTDVWINGTFAGQHQGGYAAFTFDITSLLNFGQDNVIAVKVNNASFADIPPLSADFTFFGGIYRDVQLIVTDPVNISPLDYGAPGVYLQTVGVSSNSAQVRVTTVLANASPSPAETTVRAWIVDASGKIVAQTNGTVVLPGTGGSNFVLSTSVSSPHLWNGPADPYLYRAHIEILRGNTLVDYLSQPLGFRYFQFDPNTGFSLNGRSLRLHGVNLHQDWLNCGWALTNAQRETNFALIREMGANTIRLSHYQHAEHTYQLADQLGLVLWTEIPLVNKITESTAFYENAKQQLRELIRQNYNHPSVFCWGLFNEITLSTGPTPNELVRQLAEVARAEDPTRPSTAASAAGDSHASNWYSDIVSFNKYFGWYGGSFSGFGPWADNIHKTYPTNCIGVSEYGAGASIYHHSENPVAQPTPGGRFHPEEWQNIYHESHWIQMKTRPFIWATHIWNMFDFGVDSRAEGDTIGRNDKGLVTYDRKVKKDAFYFYKASWNPDPMVYITGHTFTNRKSMTVTAKVYSNCDAVDLWVNGAFQGTVAPSNCIATWPVTLQTSNYVVAIGRSGAVTRQDSLVWLLTQEPWRGYPFSIPGRIQAEEFNSGAPGIAFYDSDSTNSGRAFRTNEPVDIETCADTGGGWNLTSVAPGEWLNYEVTVASSGYYDLQLRIATASTTASLRMNLDGQPWVPETLLPNSGALTTWITTTITNLPLSAGRHRLQLYAGTGNFKLNWMHFQYRPSSTALAYKINFQATATATPAGYLRDTGRIYTAQSPTAFGWDVDGTGHGRERNSTNSADKRYDTLMHLQRNGTNIAWEMAVPNARYLVYAVSGDPDYTDSSHNLLAEGLPLLQGTPTSEGRWIESATEVEVQDGRLTISPAPSGSNSKICFLELAQTLPGISFSEASLAASEFGSASNLTCTILRNGNSGSPLNVQYTVAGSALPGEDLAPLSGSALLPAGTDSLPLSINILPDDLAEGPETLTLTFAASSAYWIGSNSSAAILIQDKPDQQWRFTTFGSNANNPLIAGSPANPDNDRLSNAQEYVFGTDPLRPETNATWQVTIETNSIAVRTTRRANTPDANLKCLAAPALSGPWSQIPARVLKTEGEIEHVLFVDPQPMSNAPCRYLQLKVE